MAACQSAAAAASVHHVRQFPVGGCCPAPGVSLYARRLCFTGPCMITRDAWDLNDASIIYISLPLIQELLAPQQHLERLLRCPACSEASSTSSPLKLDGAAKLRRACGPESTYIYIWSNKYRHDSSPKGLSCHPPSAGLGLRLLSD